MIIVYCYKCGFLIGKFPWSEGKHCFWLEMPKTCPKCGRELHNKPIEVELKWKVTRKDVILSKIHSKKHIEEGRKRVFAKWLRKK